MTKWARIDKDCTVTTKRSRSGTPRGEKDFTAGPDPVPVTTAQLEDILRQKAGEEVAAPADKGTDKSGQVVDRKPAETAAGEPKTKA